MKEIIYVSRAVKRYEAEELTQMLLAFRQKNSTDNITGLLLYDGRGTFLQLLEGPETAVDKLYKKISQDQRHSRVNILGEREIDKRYFPDWTMGYKNLSLEANINIKGFSNFMEQKDTSTFVNEKPSFGVELLYHFRDKA